MKKLPLLLGILAILCFSHLTFSQLLFEENFNFSGPVLGSNGWLLSGTNVTNPEATVTPGLSFTNYTSVSGNACSLANSGQDIYKLTTAPDSLGSFYLSFLVKVSAVQTGDYFIAMSASYAQTNYYCRIFMKSAVGGFNIGVSKSNENAAGASYGATVLPLNTTYLIVAKYQYVAGDSNDVMSVWAFADGTLPSTEPGTGEVINYGTNTKADVGNIGIVTLRQGTSTSAPTMTIDGIRVQKSWADLGGSTPVELTSFTASVTKGAVNLSWKTATEVNNMGFNVERSANKSDWAKIVFVQGNQTSTSTKSYSYIDKSVGQSGNYYYRLKQIDNDGSYKYSNIAEASVNSPSVFSLNQNYPNPFNPSTIISYSLPMASNVKLIVYNAIGQPVRVLENGFKSAGSYSVSFNASELSSGIYFCKIEAGQYSQIRKMMLVK
jgi:hypothetical protein